MAPKNSEEITVNWREVQIKNSATKDLIVLNKSHKQSISVILGDYRVVNNT